MRISTTASLLRRRLAGVIPNPPTRFSHARFHARFCPDSIFTRALSTRVRTGMTGALQRMESMGGHVTHAENEIAKVKQLVLDLNTKIDAIINHHGIKIVQQPQQQLPVAAAVTQTQMAAAVPAGYDAAAAAMNAAATLSHLTNLVSYQEQFE